MPKLPSAARATLIAAGAVLALTGAAIGPAQAQGTLTASYTISVARIPVGKLAWSADIGADSYDIAGSGEASGIASFLASGKGTLATRGTVTDGRLSPTEFSSDITQDDGKGRQTMRLEQGSVTELTIDPPAPAADPDRVPLTAAHQQGVVDPLTAWLVPAAGAGDGLGREACERTLPVFDGQKRYDLKLAFQRMDKAKADKGYQGPALVCAVDLAADRRPSSGKLDGQVPGGRPRHRAVAGAGRRHAPAGADPRAGRQYARQHRGAGESNSRPPRNPRRGRRLRHSKAGIDSG